MNDIKNYIDINDLFNTYKIGKVIEQPLRISGGLMHWKNRHIRYY